MSKWQIRLIKAAQEELGTLPKGLQARFLRVAELLQEFGPQKVGFPHVKPLENKLWEIRLRGKDGIARAIYFLVGYQQIIIVRIFTKKTQKTPRREIKLALHRMKAFLTNEVSR